jgi:tetratricopeptide (TPR) repeat protein
MTLIAILPALVKSEERKDSPLSTGFERLQEFSKWAEYDSVIALGEPLILDRNLKDTEKALIRLNLGVAYYSRGRVIESAREFLRARGMDPGLSLDPLYVDREILDHYRFTLESEAYLESVRNSERRKAGKAALSRSRSDLFLAFLGFGAAAAGTALAAVAYSDGEAAYRDLQKAASVTGKPADYASAKSAVRSADKRTLAFGALGTGGLLAGGFMLAEYLVLKKRATRGAVQSHASVSIGTRGAGGSAAWSF